MLRAGRSQVIFGQGQPPIEYFSQRLHSPVTAVRALVMWRKMGNPKLWCYCNVKSLLFVCRAFRKSNSVYRSFPIQYRQSIVMMKPIVKHSNSFSFCLELSSRIGLAHAPLRDLKAAHSSLPSRRFFFFLKVSQIGLPHISLPTMIIYLYG